MTTVPRVGFPSVSLQQQTLTRRNESQGGRRSSQERLNRRRLLGSAAAGGTGLAALTLASCSGASRATQAGKSGAGAKTAAGAPQSGGTLTFFLPDNPATLDPQKVTGHQTMMPAGAVMSRLFRAKLGPTTEIALQHQIENDLALSAESPDATTWTVKLRPNAKFHNVAPVNGHAVEAEDIKATFARALDRATNNPSAGLLGMVDPNQIETPAKDTVIFRLKFQYAPFPTLLATPLYAWIYPREVLAGAYDPAKQMIGSGPFLFDSYTPDVAIALKKNPDWFEAASGRPYVDGVRIAVIPQTAQQIAQFAAGNLDILNALVLPADADAAKKQSPKAQSYVTPGTSCRVFYFQLGDPASPFQDIRLRRALSLAVDRQNLSRALYNDQAEIAFYVPPSQGTWSLKLSQLDPSAAQYYKADLAQAKKLFAEGGGASLRPRLIFRTGFGGSDEDSKLTQAVGNMLQSLTPQVSVASQDYLKDFVGGGKGSRYGNFPSDEVQSGGTAPSIADVDGVLFGYYDSQSTSNEGRLKDPKLDALITKARSTLKEDEQRQAYLEVQKYIAGQMYSLGGLPVGNNYMVVAPRVQNFTVSLEDGNDGLSWAQLWLAKA